MKTGWVLLLAVGLGSCVESPLPNCNPSREEAFGCLERHRGKSGREMLLACYPFSKPERIEGAWVAGFETNEFYEGEPVSESLVGKRVGDTQLETEIPVRSGPFPQLHKLDFVGRRSLCDMGFPKSIIVVDRVISRREVR